MINEQIIDKKVKCPLLQICLGVLNAKMEGKITKHQSVNLFHHATKIQLLTNHSNR